MLDRLPLHRAICSAYGGVLLVLLELSNLMGPFGEAVECRGVEVAVLLQESDGVLPRDLGVL